MIDVKPLVEETLNDAASVVKCRFGDEGVRVLRFNMKNPARKVVSDAGFIGYDDGAPVAFQASILRKAFYGRELFYACVGGLSCLKSKAAAEAFIDVRAAENTLVAKLPTSRRLGFGNSLCRETAAMARRDKRSGKTPQSCSTVLIWRVNKLLLVYLGARYWLQRIRRKIFRTPLSEKKWPDFSTMSSCGFQRRDGDLLIKRLMAFDSEFDSLNHRYVQSNQGLVLSRSSEELAWIFGDRLAVGQVVLLGAYRGAELVGYIVISGKKPARYWRIVDWFALDNDQVVLESLLKNSCEFVRKCTPAITFECNGFPTFVQSLLQKYFPEKKEIGYSTFTWGSRNKEFREELEKVIDTPKSWFFGPYDGDACYE